MRGVGLVLSVLTLAGLPLMSTANAADGETCQGEPATIVQSEGIVEGTDGDDVIVGGQDTKVRAGRGNDVICVTGGRVEGGDGVDSIEMRGTDVEDFIEVRNVEAVDVETGAGPDHARVVNAAAYTGVDGGIDLGDGFDIVSVVVNRGPVSVDMRSGSVEFDEFDAIALAGAENASASARTVRMVGDRGDNELSADGCRVAIAGGFGNDVLRVVDAHWISKACDDRRQLLRGKRGDDKLVGGRLGDLLYGNSGDDLAVGKAGHDICSAEKEKSCER